MNHFEHFIRYLWGWTLTSTCTLYHKIMCGTALSLNVRGMNVD